MHSGAALTGGMESFSTKNSLWPGSEVVCVGDGNSGFVLPQALEGIVPASLTSWTIMKGLHFRVPDSSSGSSSAEGRVVLVVCGAGTARGLLLLEHMSLSF